MFDNEEAFAYLSEKSFVNFKEYHNDIHLRISIQN